MEREISLHCANLFSLSFPLTSHSSTSDLPFKLYKKLFRLWFLMTLFRAIGDRFLRYKTERMKPERFPAG